MNSHVWRNDLLNRKEEGQQLITYLTGRYEKNKNKPFVLNVNAEWGYGKTFFLNNLGMELKIKGYSVVQFDAWKNDYTKEPLLAFMSELNISLEKFFNKRQTKSKGLLKSLKKNSLPILMSVLSRKFTGYSLTELSKLNEDEDEDVDNSEITSHTDIENGVASITSKLTEYALNEHYKVKNSIEEFKTSMKKLLKYIESLQNHQLPLFILIDELDRCRPNYAIELLENIKHLFDIEGIVFIIATDSKQLAHSINAVYGEKFHSEKYLKRFFDQEYNLKIPTNYNYITNLFCSNNIEINNIIFSPIEEGLYQGRNVNIELFNILSESFSLTLRDMNQVMTSLVTIIISWTYKEKIQLPYLLFLIMLKQLNNEEFFKYIKNKQNTVEVFKQLDLNNTFIDTCYKNEVHRSINKRYSIIELIESYNEMTNIKFSSFLNIRNNNKYTILRKPYQSIYLEASEICEDDDIMNTKLNKYSDLVLYAGQFN